jgi:hypothetical protein
MASLSQRRPRRPPPMHVLPPSPPPPFPMHVPLTVGVDRDPRLQAGNVSRQVDVSSSSKVHQPPAAAAAGS